MTTSSKFEVRMAPGAVGLVPQGTTTLPMHAFKDMTAMKDVSLPSTLRCIREGAFQGCTGLLSVTLPPHLTSIEDRAFEGCSSLMIVKIPKSLRKIGRRAFEGCNAILRFEAEPDGRYSAPGGALYDKQTSTLVRYPPASSKGCVRIRFDMERIADGAFSGCSDMVGLDFMSTSCEASPAAFEGCDRMSLINGLPYLMSEDGTVTYVAPRPPNKTVCLQNATAIGPRAFSHVRALNVLILPSSLETADPAAFEGCNPDQLNLEAGFRCPLPFGLRDELGAVIPAGVSGGWTYTRAEDGGYIVGRKFRGDTRRWDPDYDFDFSRFINSDFDDEEDEEEDEEEDALEAFTEGPGIPGFSHGRKFEPVSVEGCSLDDIAGMEETKELIRNHIILPAENPELFKRFGMEPSTGILLYGPPGNGKTLTARAIAAEMDAAFFSVKVSDITGEFVGTEEKNIHALFEAARSHDVSVIFIDDADSLMCARGNPLQPWADFAISQLLVEMDGLEQHEGTLIVLAASNRPWAMDTALLRSGRFSSRIHVDLPDARARKEIFAMKTGDAPCADDVDFEALASLTKNYSGADIEEVVNHAKMHRILLTSRGEGDGRLTAEDFEKALSEVPASTSEKDLRDIENYKRTGRGPDGDGNYVPTKVQRKMPDAGYN